MSEHLNHFAIHYCTYVCVSSGDSASGGSIFHDIFMIVCGLPKIEEKYFLMRNIWIESNCIQRVGDWYQVCITNAIRSSSMREGPLLRKHRETRSNRKARSMLRNTSPLNVDPAARSGSSRASARNPFFCVRANFLNASILS